MYTKSCGHVQCQLHACMYCIYKYSESSQHSKPYIYIYTFPDGDGKNDDVV